MNKWFEWIFAVWTCIHLYLCSFLYQRAKRLYVYCSTNTQHKTCGAEIGGPPVVGRGTDNTGLCWLRLAQWPTQHKNKSPAALHCGFATNISWVYVSVKGFILLQRRATVLLDAACSGGTHGSSNPQSSGICAFSQHCLPLSGHLYQHSWFLFLIILTPLCHIMWKLLWCSSAFLDAFILCIFLAA